MHFQSPYLSLINWNYSITHNTRGVWVFIHYMVYASCNLLLKKGFSYNEAGNNLWLLWIWGKAVTQQSPTMVELHPQSQMSLWFCFLSLFEANGVTVMTSPLSVKMGRISSLLLLSFLSQWCEADGRTLFLGLPGKNWSCHHFLSAGLIQLPIFLRDEGLRWQFHYSETSYWQESLSLNIAFCIPCCSHSLP